MRVQICRITDRSWEMKTYVRLNSSCSATEQVEDLRLHGDVERRDRLVADDQLRVERERAGDPDPLTLPARELVRVAARVLAAEPDDLEELRTRSLASRLDMPPWIANGWTTICSTRLPRIERRIRVLEDHLHLASQRTQLAVDSA